MSWPPPLQGRVNHCERERPFFFPLPVDQECVCDSFMSVHLNAPLGVLMKDMAWTFSGPFLTCSHRWLMDLGRAATVFCPNQLFLKLRNVHSTQDHVPHIFFFFLSHRDFTSENYFGWWTICWLYIVLSVDFALLNVFHGLEAQFSFMLIAVIAQSSIMEPGMWNAGKADIYSHSNWIDFYLNGWPQIPPSAVISVQLLLSLCVVVYFHAVDSRCSGPCSGCSC